MCYDLGINNSTDKTMVLWIGTVEIQSYSRQLHAIAWKFGLDYSGFGHVR